MTCNNLYTATAIALVSLLMAPAIGEAASFTITNGQNVGAQTIGAGDTGTVDAGGTVSTSADNDYAITINGTSTILNNGTVSTAGNDGDAIRTTGASTYITSNGNITVTNNVADGIVLDTGSDNSVVINNGTISIGGDAGQGIYVVANNVQATNNGSITTLVDNSSAFNVVGANTTNINNGSITTSGTGSQGMRTYNDSGNLLLNTGSIVTQGTDSYGLESSFTGNTLINTGVITTHGDNADGIVTNSTATYIINTGTLTINAQNADGITVNAGADNSTVLNNGMITVIGTGANGINNLADNTIITNNGIITATGNSVNAINSSTANNTTVILVANSQTNGNILFGGGNNILQYSMTGADREGGSVTSVGGNVAGAHSTIITGISGLRRGSQIAAGSNAVAVVTADNFAGTQQVISQTLNRSSELLTQHQQLAMLGENTGVSEGTQVAALDSDATSAAGWGVHEKSQIWTEGFGSYQERPDYKETAFSRTRAGGVLVGIDRPKESNDYRAGAYVGGFAGSIDMGNTTFRTIDSTGMMAGGYVGKNVGEYYLTGQVALGVSGNDSDRIIGGATAHADYNSYFFSPSVTLMRAFPAQKVTWVPSLTVNYTGQYDESYTESGSLANQSVDSRYINSIGARALMEAHLHKLHFRSGSQLASTFRAGVEGQTLVGNTNIDVNVLGNNLSFDPNGYNNNVDGVFGINLAYALPKGPELYTDAEMIIGLNKGGPSDNVGGVGQIGARWKF